MDRIFIPIFRFFERRKWALYLVLALTSLTFVLFGLQVQYEEDISKLLPQTDKATEACYAALKLLDETGLRHSVSGESMAITLEASNANKKISWLYLSGIATQAANFHTRIAYNFSMFQQLT